MADATSVPTPNPLHSSDQNSDTLNPVPNPSLHPALNPALNRTISATSSTGGDSGFCTPFFSRAGSRDGTATPVTTGSVLFDDEEEAAERTRNQNSQREQENEAENISDGHAMPNHNAEELGPDMLNVPVPSNNDRPYILVLGGLGYIGSHTTLELAKAGYNVAIVDDMSNSFDSVLQNIRFLVKEHYRGANAKVEEVPDMPFFQTDYRDRAAMEALLNKFALPQTSPDTARSRIAGVIHFAAYKSVSESISRPIEYYQNNVCGLVELVSQLGRFGIYNFVFSSSATVYGTMANRGRPLREHNMVHHAVRVKVGADDASRADGNHSPTKSTFFSFKSGNDEQEILIEPGSLGITSPYGRTKYMCEAILADIAYADPRWKITLLRYFNPVGCHESGLLGEHPRQTPTNLVPVLIQVLTGEREKIEIFGTDYDTPDGTAVRDFIHVQDLARGHIAAVAAVERRMKAEAGGSSGAGNDTSDTATVPGEVKIYNLGTGSGHTVKEVLHAIESASGKTIPAIEVGRRAGDVGFCVAAVAHAERELQWKAEKTLEDSARDVWNYTVKCRGLTEEGGNANANVEKGLVKGWSSRPALWQPEKVEPVQARAAGVEKYVPSGGGSVPAIVSSEGPGGTAIAAANNKVDNKTNNTGPESQTETGPEVGLSSPVRLDKPLPNLPPTIRSEIQV